LAPLLDAVSLWTIPLLMTVILLHGLYKGVKVFEVFIEGAQEGFWLAVRLVPYLVAIFVALSIFRASGAMDLATRFLTPLTDLVGMPPEVLPLALVRPLSGTGALAVTAELINHWGPDSFIGRLASTMQGSTDTTFYVLTLYFGSVGVTRPRHAVVVGVLADVTGFLASLYVCRYYFG